MTSRKVIDIANSLELINDYNNTGITGSNFRISTSQYGELLLYSTTPSSNSTTGTLVLYNGSLSINNTQDSTSITSGGSLTIRGGASIEKSIRVGNLADINNVVSTNASIGVLNVTGITSGNINFTGNLYKNGDLYISSQWTSGTGGTLSYTNGNIGIGTTSPSTTLDVLGSIKVSGDISAGTINTIGITTGNINFSGNLYKNGELYVSSQWISGTGGALNYMDGNVGIGTTSPDYNLDVSGNLRINSGNTISLISANGIGNVFNVQNTSNSGNSTIQFSDSSSNNKLYIGYANVNSSLTTLAASSYILSENAVSLKFVAGNKTSDPVVLNANDNSISITTTTNASDIYSGALKVAGGVSIQKTLWVNNTIVADNITTNNIVYTNCTVGSINTSNLNLGVCNIFSGSFTPSNNVTIPTNITGLLFDKDQTGSFTINLNVTIVKTGVDLYETFLLEGNYTEDSQWSLYSTSYGNISGIVFSITSNGQIQYTSTNISGFTNSIFRFVVNQISSTGSYNYTGLQTQGTLITNNIQILSTEDSNIGTNNGSIYSVGGATISKTLYALNISSGSAQITNQTVGVLNVTGITASNINFTGSLYQNGSIYISSQWLSGTGGALSYTGGNVGIGTTSPNHTLDVNGGIRSTNMTSTNILATSISASTLVGSIITGGNLSLSGNLTIAGTLTTVNITTTNLSQTNVSAGNITSTNISSGTLNASSLLAIGNSNTVGNIYTTGGNVGIGTTNPGSSLHVAGSIVSSPTGNGVLMGIDSNGNSVIQLNSSVGSYIDFSTSGVDNKGRILYDSTSNYIEINTNSTAMARFTSAGNFICTGDITVFGSLSDRRLKENIENITLDNALNTVRSLRPVTFDWRGDIFNKSKRNKSDIGFIAQEVEPLIPEAVTDYEEISSGKVYKSIKHERLIPYLVGAVQQLDYENRTKGYEIDNLKKIIFNLMEKLNK